MTNSAKFHTNVYYNLSEHFYVKLCTLLLQLRERGTQQAETRFVKRRSLPYESRLLDF